MPNQVKPSICALAAHILRRFKRLGLRGRALAGVLCLLLNVPIGWGGSLLVVTIAEATKRRWLYSIATGIYLLSWGILFLGVFLAGAELHKRVRTIIPAAWKARKRYLALHKN